MPEKQFKASTITIPQITNWDSTGQTKFIENCLHNEGCFMSLHSLFYDLCKIYLDDQLTNAQLISTVKNIFEQNKKIQVQLINILVILDFEYASKNSHAKYIELVILCKKYVCNDLLRAELEYETLESAKIIISKKVSNQRYIRHKTKHFYKQHKYNLLREESEGFAKVIRQLDSIDANTWRIVIENIELLCGRFSLCQIRVLDLILDLFERRPQNHPLLFQFLELYFKKGTRSTLNHVFGFRLANRLKELKPDNAPEMKLKADAMYRLAAFMISYNLLDLSLFMIHLSPSSKRASDEFTDYIKQCKDICSKLPPCIIQTNVKETTVLPIINMNQKLAILNELLKIGSFKHFFAIAQTLPHYYLLAQPTLVDTYCKVMHHIIQPLYAKKSGLHISLTKKWRPPTTSLKYQCVPVHQCKSFDDLPNVLTKISFLGPYIAVDVLLYVKVMRLCISFVNEYRAKKIPTPGYKQIYMQIRTVIVDILLPGLSVLEYNCAISEELWELISTFRYEDRYTMYSAWKRDVFSSNKYPILMMACAIISAKTKYVLKRITKDNVKEYGRQIGKLSHSNPTVIFHMILSQIQQFGNFIVPIVDSLKYLTGLTYDVIGFSVIDSMTLNTETRLKNDDTNVSLWLQSTAHFAATAYRRYPIDMSGALHYMLSELHKQRSDDLVLLREMLINVAGVELASNRTDQQFEAMSGGHFLLQGAYYKFNQRKASSRLTETMLKHKIGMPLLLLITQQRDNIIYVKSKTKLAEYEDEALADKRPLKLIGHLYDLCTDTMHQLMTFIEQNMTSREVYNFTPAINILMTDKYQLNIESAFAICRPMMKHEIWTKYTKSYAKLQAAAKSLDKPKETASTINDNKSVCFKKAIDEVMIPVLEYVKSQYCIETWEGLTHEIFTMFWTFTLSDLQVPNDAYSRQIASYNAEIRAIDKYNISSYKKKKEKEKMISLIEKLKSEQKKQEEYVTRVLDYVKRNSPEWFSMKSAKVGHMLMQLMVFPRCTFNSLDAIYCAKFLLLLHRNRIENFYSLICFDKIFIEIALPMGICTENEAERYGRFLCSLFGEINRWHSNIDIYNKECNNHPGFKTCFKGGQDKESNESEQLDYENYRHIVHKWHHSITKLFVYNLESNRYQHIKTSLIVMKQILPVYPIVEKLGMALQRRVQRVCDNEKNDRPDLWALAMGYLGQMSTKQRHWISETKFHEDKAQKAYRKSAKKSETVKDNNSTRDNSSKDSKKRKNEGSSDNREPENNKKRNRDTSNDRSSNSSNSKYNKDSSKKSKSSNNINSPRDKMRSSRSSRN